MRPVVKDAIARARTGEAAMRCASAMNSSMLQHVAIGIPEAGELAVSL